MYLKLKKENSWLIESLNHKDYNCSTLIALCDNMNISVSGLIGVPFKMKFFMRTLTGNKIASDSSGETLFEVVPDEVANIDMTLTDYSLLCSKKFVAGLFIPDTPLQLMPMHCIPTPFGAILGEDNSVELVFQIVYREGLTLSDTYKLVDISESTHSKIRTTFRRTKD